MLRHLVLCIAVIGLAAVGCEDPKPKPAPEAPAPTEAPRDLTEEVSQGLRQGAQEAKDLTRQAAEKGEELIEQAKPHVQAATEEVKEAATQAKQVVGEQVQQLVNPTRDAAPATTQASAKELNQKIDLAMRYAQERKLDLADKTLAQVEAQSGQLSAAGKARMQTVRDMINAAKQAQNFRNVAKPAPQLP